MQQWQPQEIVAEVAALKKAHYSEAGIVAVRNRLLSADKTIWCHDLLAVLFREMQFEKQQTQEHLQKIFHLFAVPLYEYLFGIQYYNQALYLEALLYAEYVKSSENEQHVQAIYDKLTPIAVDSGKKARALLPKVNVNMASNTTAFFVHNAVNLAHVQVLMAFIEGSQAIKDRQTYVVIFFAGYEPFLEKFFLSHGVKTLFLNKIFPEISHKIYDKLLMVRKILASNHIEQLVFLSLLVYMPFAYSMRLAPVQTWWALKYHFLALEDIEGYVTLAAEKSVRHFGRLWRAGRIAQSDWYDASLSAEAKVIRAQYGEDTVIIASFAREEKLTDSSYLQAIATVLRSNDKTRYLWAGRTELPLIRDFFIAQGVAEQVHFIGWVNTKLYAQVIDIFADSFPYPCGFTLYQAMAAGKPAIFYKSHESMKTGMPAIAVPILNNPQHEDHQRLKTLFGDHNGEPTFLIAEEAETYGQWLLDLSKDKQRREIIGAACKKFVEHFCSSKEKCAAVYVQHLKEIAAETLSVQQPRRILQGENRHFPP